MAYAGMAYIAMAYLGMAYTVMAYTVMANTVMAYSVMGYTVTKTRTCHKTSVEILLCKAKYSLWRANLSLPILF